MSKGRYVSKGSTGVVYALIDPRCDRIRYIGKSMRSPGTRLYVHNREAIRGVRSHKANWIRSVLKDGDVPSLLVLASGLTEREANGIEKMWIAKCHQSGYWLTNATAGGEGMVDPSPETRAKLRRRPRQVVTDEMRRARSDSMRRRYDDPVERERMVGIARAVGESRRDPSKPNSKYRLDDNGNVVRKRQVEIGPNGTPENIAWRKAHGVAMGRTQGPKNTQQRSAETRAKLSAAAKRQHADGRGPDYSDPERNRKIAESQRRIAAVRRKGGDAQ